VKLPRFPPPSNVSNFGAIFTEGDFGLTVQCGFKVTLLARRERTVFMNDNRVFCFDDVKEVSVQPIHHEDTELVSHFAVIIAASFWNEVWVALELREDDAYAVAERIRLYLESTTDQPRA